MSGEQPITTDDLAHRIAWHLIGNGYENRYHRNEGTVNEQVAKMAAVIQEAINNEYDPTTRDVLRHKLIADLFELPIWHRDGKRYVDPGWKLITVEERDLIA